MTPEDRIRAFDATAANLAKAKKIWAQMERVMPTGNVASDEAKTKYDTLRRTFEEYRASLPAIEGKHLPNLLEDYYTVFQMHFDAREIGEPEALIAAAEQSGAQGDAILDYEYSLRKARREFVQAYVGDLLGRATTIAKKLTSRNERKRPIDSVRGKEWSDLEQLISTLDRLLGDAADRPQRWTDLQRHLRFGQKQDLLDIVEQDLPNVVEELPRILSIDEGPLAVPVANLSGGTPEPLTQALIPQLKWKVLDAEAFERLCQDILASTPGWQNPKWLLHTNAPDRGRDIEVEKVDQDVLVGSSVRRVIVQCKHRPHDSIGVDETSGLLTQMESLGRVDILVIATSGKFTDPVLQFQEAHNKKDRLPVIQLWNHWELERILAQRPDLIAQYGLG